MLTGLMNCVFTAQYYTQRSNATASASRLSVTLRYRDHLGWILHHRQTQTPQIYSNGNTPTFWPE